MRIIGGSGPPRAEGNRFRSVTAPAHQHPRPDKKKLDSKRAWGEMRALMAQHKRSLAIGFSLMIVNRLSGMVLPASSKWLIDEVIRYSGPYSYVDGLILRTTRNYATVTCLHDPRQEGKSGYTLRKLVALWLNMFTNFSILPLRIASVTGLFVAGIGLVLAIVFLIEKLLYPDLQRGWAFMKTEMNEFVDLLPAQQRVDEESWYRGTADAVSQNQDILDGYDADYVVVLAGDHVYKMNYALMLADHVAQGRPCSVACIEVAR